MSSALVPVTAPQPTRMPSRTPSARLRLVRPEERVVPDECLLLDEGVRGSASRAIRPTRRGRLVITLLTAAAVTTLVIMLATGVGIMLATGVDAAAPLIDHATTVRAGQTLSEVAADQLPSLPNSDAVARIQLVNGLNTLQVQAGQSLLIPAMP